MAWWSGAGGQTARPLAPSCCCSFADADDADFGSCRPLRELFGHRIWATCRPWIQLALVAHFLHAHRPCPCRELSCFARLHST
eukprot:4602961-Karenia_brevis.AAC.1